MVVPAAATLAAAYLVGSFPTGYLAGRARGVDLRKLGSGNIGATNALRVLGKPAGTFVLLVDAAKGWFSCAILPGLVLRLLGTVPTGGTPAWLAVLGGLGAVLGHNFTCWLRFRGGKGVATSAGVLLGLLPASFAAVIGVFLLSLLVTRIVSLSSLLAAASLPVATWLWHREPVLLAFSLLLSVLVFVRHRSNIQRLLAGTEPRIGQARAGSAPPPAPSPTHPAPKP